MVSKKVHLIAAFAVLVVAVLSILAVSDLRKDLVTTLGTVGFFVTIYGVLFTIVEVLRAKSAATIAADEAKGAARAVQALYGIQDLTECQSRITFALECIEKDGLVPSSALAHIIKLYSAEFAREYKNESSSCRQNVGLMQSYASIRSPKRPTSTGRLKDTLLAMMAELSVAGVDRLGEANV